MLQSVPLKPHLLLDVIPGDSQAVGGVVVLPDSGVQLGDQSLAQLYFEDEAQHHHYQLQQKRERHTAEILEQNGASVRTQNKERHISPAFLHEIPDTYLGHSSPSLSNRS